MHLSGCVKVKQEISKEIERVSKWVSKMETCWVPGKEERKDQTRETQLAQIWAKTKEESKGVE